MDTSPPSTTPMLSLRSELDHLTLRLADPLIAAAGPSLLQVTIRQRLASRGWVPDPFRRGPLSAVSDAALVSLLVAAADELDRLLILYADDVEPLPLADALAELDAARR